MTTTPRPELLPKGSTLVSWALTPEAYEQRAHDWRKWPPGAWDDEPDRIEWRAPGSKLPRLALRNNFGAWCGYVGLSEDHPLYGKTWSDPKAEALSVHGGLTFGNACAGHICHVPRAGESDHVWWLGFDCCHSGDVAPGLRLPPDGLQDYEHYRDAAYVIREVEALAAQLDPYSPDHQPKDPP